MMKRICAAMVLALLATAILLPNAACRQNNVPETAIPSFDNLDVLL